MKISIELDDRDWGKVLPELMGAINRRRKIKALTRIRTSIRTQRRAAKPPRKLKREASEAMKADMYGENGNG